MQATLARLGYLALGKRAKGIVRRYVLVVTGYSRTQGTRLIRQYQYFCRLLNTPNATEPFISHRT